MARKPTDKPRRPAAAGPPPPAAPPPAAEGGVRPWHLLLVATAIAVAAGVFATQGTSASTRSAIVVAIATVGLGRRRGGADRRAAGGPRSRRADRDGRRAHAGRPRAREVAGAALDQGGGVRPRDGEDLRRRLSRGGGKASRPRGGAAAPARRRQLGLPGADRARARDARGAPGSVPAAGGIRGGDTGHASPGGRAPAPPAARRMTRTRGSASRAARESRRPDEHPPDDGPGRGRPAAPSRVLPVLAAAQMPDARQMSGIPMPTSDVPAGSVSVRLVRGELTNNIVGHPVELHGGARAETVKTDQDGRAMFAGLQPGTAGARGGGRRRAADRVTDVQRAARRRRPARARCRRIRDSGRRRAPCRRPRPARWCSPATAGSRLSSMTTPSKCSTSSTS